MHHFRKENLTAVRIKPEICSIPAADALAL
jgi:hypothetical protein